MAEVGLFSAIKERSFQVQTLDTITGTPQSQSFQLFAVAQIALCDSQIPPFILFPYDNLSGHILISYDLATN